jgi:hypothetical protein
LPIAHDCSISKKSKNSIAKIKRCLKVGGYTLNSNARRREIGRISLSPMNIWDCGVEWMLYGLGMAS